MFFTFAKWRVQSSYWFGDV